MVDKNNVLDLKKSDVSYFLSVNLSQLLRSSRKRFLYVYLHDLKREINDNIRSYEIKDELNYIIQNKKMDFLISENE